MIERLRIVVQMPNLDLLTTAEAASLLDVSIATVNRMADQGKLREAKKFPGIRGARLYKRRDVEALATRRAAA